MGKKAVRRVKKPYRGGKPSPAQLKAQKKAVYKRPFKPSTPSSSSSSPSSSRRPSSSSSLPPLRRRPKTKTQRLEYQSTHPRRPSHPSAAAKGEQRVGQKRKAREEDERAEEERADDGAEKEADAAAEGAKRRKKGKVLVADAASALALVDRIAGATEERQKGRLAREEAKYAGLQRRKESAEERKKRRKALKTQAAQQAKRLLNRRKKGSSSAGEDDR